MIRKEGKILMGRRKGPHGIGRWSVPGGHLEFNEELEECVKREVLEEAGIQIKNVRIGTFTNDTKMRDEKHYITIFMLCDYDSGDVRLMEHEKCGGWEWVNWGELPSPLFDPIENLLKQGFDPFREVSKI